MVTFGEYEYAQEVIDKGKSRLFISIVLNPAGVYQKSCYVNISSVPKTIGT